MSSQPPNTGHMVFLVNKQGCIFSLNPAFDNRRIFWRRRENITREVLYAVFYALCIGPDEEQQEVEAHHTVVFGDGDTIKVQNKVRTKTPQTCPSQTFPSSVTFLDC